MKNDLIHLASQRKLVKDSSVDVADNANMWAHGIPASYLRAVWSSIIPPCCQMVQFHLTVELPFLDFPDFFRLDVSSPQFVRLFTAGSFMFFPPELVELFGDWWFRIGFIRLLLGFFLHHQVRAGAPAKPSRVPCRAGAGSDEESWKGRQSASAVAGQNAGEAQGVLSWGWGGWVRLVVGEEILAW